MLLPGIGQTHDVAAHEYRHAQIAREMLERREYVAPTLLGLRYADKPPVEHLLMATLFRLTGRTTITVARLPSVVAAVIALLALYELARLLADRRTGVAAALGLLAVANFQRMARAARPDMLMTAAAVVACAALLHGLRRRGGRRLAWLGAAGLAAGAALVTKGPVGLAVPVLVGGFTALLRPDDARLRLGDVATFGCGVAAAIAAWAVPTYLHDGGVLLRAVVTQRDLSLTPDAQLKPVWWYLVVLPFAFLPLTLLLPLVGRDVRRRGWSVAAASGLLLFALLSVAPKKRQHYLLPLYPLLAAAVAEAVLREPDARWRTAAAALVAVTLVGGPLYFAGRTLVAEDNDPKLDAAHQILARVEPDATVVCLRDLGEEVAFEGRRRNVRLALSPRDVARWVERASGAVYVVVPDDADHDQVLHVVRSRVALAPAFRATVPRAHRTLAWDVYRAGGAAPSPG